jgi:hypothetical protein
MNVDAIDDLYCSVKCARNNERELRELFAEVRWLRKQAVEAEDQATLEGLSKEINRFLEMCEAGSPQRHFNDGVYRSYHDFRS